MNGNIATHTEIDDKIIEVVERIKPAIAMHAGDVDFVKFENGIVYLKMLGSCTHCALSQMTLKLGIEEMLKSEIPEILGVEAV